MEVTLDMILASREARQKEQEYLLKHSYGSTLISMTVVMPGNVKRDEYTIKIAEAGIDALLNAFDGGINRIVQRDLETGYEAFLLVKAPLEETKRVVSLIEETHPRGRLFDIDVIGEDGVPVTRTGYGMTPRKCLLCDNEARYCMRNHTHTPEQLKARIREMVDEYVR